MPKNQRETDDTEEQEFESMPHLAAGDLIMPPQDDFSLGTSSFDVNTGDSGTVKSPLMAPQMATGADPSGTGPKPATVTHPTALAEKASNAPPMPGMPADVTPDELERYLQRAKQSYGQYGAGPQLDTAMGLIKSRTGPLSSLANAGAGFADALMQGVARAGNPGFQKNLQDRQQGVYNDVTGAVKGAHDTAQGDIKADIELDSKNPASPMSRAVQKAYASTLIAAGIPKDQVQNVSADLAGDISAKRITLEDALARMKLENTYRMGELNLQGLTAQANIANQQATRRESAAGKLADRGLWRRSADYLTGNPATKALEGEITAGTTGTFEPDVMRFAQTHNITPEQAKAIKDKRSGGQ